jgi:hypothetical protein
MGNVLKIVFIDGQLLGIIIGSCISFLFYKVSKNDSKEIQKNIWKKEFDRYQIEPFIEIFRSILSVLNNNAVASVKMDISQDALNRLKIELQLVRYFKDSLRKKINDHIYKDCLEYNKTIYQYSLEGSERSSSTKETKIDMVVNEGRVEKEKREAIEKNITEVIDEIKSIYSEF